MYNKGVNIPPYKVGDEITATIVEVRRQQKEHRENKESGMAMW
jgi:hypothetical protein